MAHSLLLTILFLSSPFFLNIYIYIILKQLPVPPPLFIGMFSFLILLAGLFPTRFFGIFSHSLLVSPLSYLETGLLGGFVLFRLSHTYLIQQRLDREPLINVEVKISIILICLGDFLSLY